MPRVLITGATGLLGRAVVAAFKSAGWEVVGASHSRSGPSLVQVDLRDASVCAALVEQTQPDVVIHSAAERRPDVCESKPEASEALNVDAVWCMGKAAAKRGAAFVHISTDYLFDGTKAPYNEDAPTCPLNAYGQQKVRGEHAALAAHPSAVVLRVPVLYGPTEDLKESAVTCFAAAVRDTSKQQSVDDWQIRYPTYTPDVAATLVRMARGLVGLPAVEGEGQTHTHTTTTHPRPRGIYNYTGDENFTRYGWVCVFGDILQLPTTHITRLEGMPPGAPRPYDCKLDAHKIYAEGWGAPITPFAVGVRSVLGLPSA